jgi:6-phosphogluconolactonase (cycloisomerase 2 family)
MFKLPLNSSTKYLQQLKFTMSGKGPNPSRQDAPHPHGVFVDPTGQYLLAPDLGADLIRIFSINQSTGQLTTCNPVSTPSGDGPRHGVFWAPNNSSTTGLMFYVVNELGNSVSAWTVSYPSGSCLSLNHTQTLSAYAAGITAPSASKSAEVHTAGNFLYLANRNDQSFGSSNDSIATYSINANTGAISFVQSTPAYTWFPRTFQINRAGDMVAIGGQTSSTVAIVSRNTTTGLLGGLVAPVLAVGQPGTYNNEDGLSAVIWNE